MKKSRTFLFKLAWCLIFVGLVFGCGSDRVGEINVYKVAPANGAMGPEKSSRVYALRGRGFAVADNAFLIRNQIGDSDSVGVEDLKKRAGDLYLEAFRTKLKISKENRDEDPKYKRLAPLLKEIEEIQRILELKSNSSQLKQEAHLNEMLNLLTMTSDFIDDLSTALQDLEETWSFSEDTTFDLPFLVMGRPLLSSDFSKVATNALTPVDIDYKRLKQAEGRALTTKGIASTSPKPVFIELNQQRFANYYSVLQGLWWVSVGAKTNSHTLLTQERIENLGDMLFFIIEDCLNFSQVVANRGSRNGGKTNRNNVNNQQGNPKDGNQTSSREADPINQIVHLRIGKGTNVNARTMGSAFRHEKLQLNKAAILTRAIKQEVDREIRNTIEHETSVIRVRLEQMSEEIAELSEQKMFRKLKPSKANEPPTYLTFILKTLFLKHLGNGKQANPAELDKALLVTCSVKHEKNAEQTIYPVIFEDHYAPSLFVNRKDRIILGPVAYTGQSFDLRFTAVELRGLNTGPLKSGFSALVNTIGAINPEYAAFAPAVNALFSGIINAATQDVFEMDFSFTVPQPEGESKADVDFLVAETGQFVIIKAENTSRKGVAAKATKRQLYRRLILNPEDGFLYYRRYLNDTKANFVEDNLFLDQNYAVIALTDEYTQPDSLGDQLRRQVAQTLGEKRAKAFLPDGGQTREMLEAFKFFTGATNSMPIIDVKGFKALAVELKDELWSPSSDVRKQFIVETLLARSEPAVKLALGTNPEKWKTAKVAVDEDGVVRFQENEEILYVKWPLTSDKVAIFFDQSGTNSPDYFIVSPDGQKARELNNIGKIGNDGFFYPTDGIKNQPSYGSFVALRTGPGATKQKRIIVSGNDFKISKLTIQTGTNNVENFPQNSSAYLKPAQEYTVRAVFDSAPADTRYSAVSIGQKLNLSSLNYTNKELVFKLVVGTNSFDQNSPLQVKICQDVFTNLCVKGVDQNIPSKTLLFEPSSPASNNNE